MTTTPTTPTLKWEMDLLGAEATASINGLDLVVERIHTSKGIVWGWAIFDLNDNEVATNEDDCATAKVAALEAELWLGLGA